MDGNHVAVLPPSQQKLYVSDDEGCSDCMHGMEITTLQLCRVGSRPSNIATRSTMHDLQ